MATRTLGLEGASDRSERAWPSLRMALAADAVASGTLGAVLAPTAGWLDGHLGLSTDLLRWAAVMMLVWGAVVGALATRSMPAPGATKLVIGLNGLWVVGSVGLLLSGRVAPSGLGYAFVIAQAAAVGVLAELQLIGLRRRA